MSTEVLPGQKGGHGEQLVAPSLRPWNFIFPVLQNTKDDYISVIASRREGVEYMDKTRNWVSVISFAAQILINDGAISNPEHNLQLREFIKTFTSPSLRGRSFHPSELRQARKALGLLISYAPNQISSP